MTLKKAVEICRNINVENITREDKIEAIQTVINSKSNSTLLNKHQTFAVLIWVMKEYEATI